MSFYPCYPREIFVESVIDENVDDLLAEQESSELSYHYPKLSETTLLSMLEQQKFLRRKRRYEREGMRSTALGVFLAHNQSIPYLLLLKGGWTGQFYLPGGHVRLGESEQDGLLRKLNKLIQQRPKPVQSQSPSAERNENSGCEVTELLGRFWCPDFSAEATPFLFPHVSRPKECISVHLVSLPENGAIFKRRKPKLLSQEQAMSRLIVNGVPICHRREPAQWVAVPLHDLLKPSAPARFGPMLCAIPALLSRLRMQPMVPKTHISWTAVRASDALQQLPVVDNQK